MSRVVAAIRLRGILDSRGCETVEAEVVLRDGSAGRGAAPVAIAPGRREAARTHVEGLGRLDRNDLFSEVNAKLTGRLFGSQAEFDDVLERLVVKERAGANVTLSLSLAFCRATARSRRVSLYEHLARLSELEPKMPRVLVNVFSGGIHDPRARVPYQQIMVLPRTAHLCDDIRAAMSVYKAVEAYLAERGRTVRQSASSGMIVEGFAPTELLDLLCERIRRLGFRNDEISLALDVAAEHLKGADGLYELGDRRITGVELLEHHRRLLESYDIAYFEDPFDPEDTELWNALLQSAPIGTRIFGDDLFATNSRHLVTGLATGVVLKMSQVGTVTATLRTAANAERLGLALCVSHRSGETEDTSMCDLAVAVGAACIKVGGPRRGDRLSKYNQLLRLDEELNSASNTRTRDATNPDRIPVTVKGEPREANRANEATLDG